MISLNGVTWRRGETVILRDVDWTVKSGEHWAVIGENGAGKTSLLEMVNGYIWPTAGTIEVLGEKFGETRIVELRKRIGWMSQAVAERFRYASPRETVLHMVLSGRDSSIGLSKPPTEDEIARGREILKAFGGEDLAERTFRFLSQGERQLALIGRAWMSDPRLLILDEPCTGLDLRAREILLEAVGRMAERPDAPTLIYVTHHPEEVLPAFTHALLMRDGRVVSAGPKEEAITPAVLSEVFDVGVDVTWSGGRPWVRVVSVGERAAGSS